MSDSQQPTLPVPAADVARPSRGIQDAAVLASPATAAASHSDTGRQGSGGSSSCGAAAAAAGSDKSRASNLAGATASEHFSRSSTRSAHADQRPLAAAAAPCDAEPNASTTGQQRAELASQIDLGSPQSTNCGGSASTASAGAGSRRNCVAQEVETGSGAACICRASRRRRKCALPLTSADEVTGSDYCYASHVGFFDAPPSCVCASADSAGGIERAQRWERWMDGASLVAHITPFAIVGVRVTPRARALSPTAPSRINSHHASTPLRNSSVPPLIPFSPTLYPSSRSPRSPPRAQVCIQFLLDELFGPNVAHVTDDALTVFVDLPANMLGAFLLGLSAVALLPALLARSRHLAIAVVVGLCGSISTFATWNQRMVSIATAGLWARAAFGYFTGSALPLVALVAGVDAGTAIRQSSAFAGAPHASSLLPSTLPSTKVPAPAPPTVPPHHRRHMLPMLLLSAALLLLAGICALLLPPTAHKWRMLACACLLAPLGTHLRFLLLCFNRGPFPLRLPFLPCARSSHSASETALLPEDGAGAGAWEWMPWGTWMANVGAAAVEAAISILFLKVRPSRPSLAHPSLPHPPLHPSPHHPHHSCHPLTLPILVLLRSPAFPVSTPLQYQSTTSEVAVGAMQLGFLACLSTVSMPSLEALYLHYTLRSPAKAYAYALLTILPSFALGLLLYSLPCWLNGYDSLYNHVGTSL
ncbi:unnamed protein product [Closterium sp. Naga37s-1]|nr:unnamed protein product [Closterium sp. Naga37s-1]